MTTWERARQRLEGKSVTIIGDVMLDAWEMMESERLSREAPCPIARLVDRRYSLGGAGNVANNLGVIKNLGLNIVGAIGGDHDGGTVADLLGECARLVVLPEHSTTVKRRYMVDGHQILRLDTNIGDLADPVWLRLAQLAQEACAKADLIVVSDYGRGVVTPLVWQACLNAGKPIIVDTKRDPMSFIGARLIKVSHLDVDLSGKAPLEYAQAVRKATDAEAVVFTRGAKGMSVVSRKENIFDVDAYRLDGEIVDVTGAGDTVTAWLGLTALLLDMSIMDACCAATVAAGIAVRQPFTYSPDPAIVFYRAQQPCGTNADALRPSASASAVIIAAHDWMRLGLRVGLANGCFDIQHEGHVRFLHWCREQCDRLIVLVNTDESVARLKGKGRPALPFVHRAALVGAQKSVDIVGPLSGDDPVSAVALIRPSIYFAGYDHASDDVVAQIHAGLGIAVQVAPRFGDDSTTSLLKDVSRYAH